MKMIFRVAVLAVGFAVLHSGTSTLFAQTPPPPAIPSQSARPPPPPSPPSTPANIVDPSAGGQPVNVRLDVTITDRTGETVVPPKIFTMLLADRALSQLRSPFEDGTVNFDVRPTIMDSHVKVQMTMASFIKGRQPGGDQRQSITVILDSGKPLVVLESTDQATNRKTTLELKATIQR